MGVRVVPCALALPRALSPLGLEVRAGLHTGEVEMTDDDVTGIAVHIGARVAQLASGGEVLASQTVRDLVFGSGLNFDDRGAYEMPRGAGRMACTRRPRVITGADVVSPRRLALAEGVGDYAPLTSRGAI